MDPRYQEMGTENELAIVLSHYESDYVYDIVKSQIQSTANSSFIAPPPNVVGAWEQNFKAIMDQYGAEGSTKIQEVRQETYREIIDIICESYGLNFTISDVDMYSAAYALYDFFVCNLPGNIINFFAKYIYKERTAIYDSMCLSEMKKNKDSSTVYGKRMYKDIKIAVINANITKVLDNICGAMEFDFPTIISVMTDDRNLIKYILSIVSDNGDFYGNIMIPIVKTYLADYVTGIRLKIQELAISHDQVIYNAAQSVENTEEIEGDQNNG